MTKYTFVISYFNLHRSSCKKEFYKTISRCFRTCQKFDGCRDIGGLGRRSTFSNKTRKLHPYVGCRNCRYVYNKDTCNLIAMSNYLLQKSWQLQSNLMHLLVPTRNILQKIKSLKVSDAAYLKLQEGTNLLCDRRVDLFFTIFRGNGFALLFLDLLDSWV